MNRVQANAEDAKGSNSSERKSEELKPGESESVMTRTNASSESEYVFREEAAQLAGVSLSTLRRAQLRGELSTHTLDGRPALRRDELLRTTIVTHAKQRERGACEFTAEQASEGYRRLRDGAKEIDLVIEMSLHAHAAHALCEAYERARKSIILDGETIDGLQRVAEGSNVDSFSDGPTLLASVRKISAARASVQKCRDCGRLAEVCSACALRAPLEKALKRDGAAQSRIAHRRKMGLDP